MRPPKHAHDTPFRALPTPSASSAKIPAPEITDALQLRNHVIAVHRIFHRVARNEHITIQLRHRHIRHHKSISVVMQHQPASHFVPSQ
jgi:hypothetical protein